jgi:hypothetical protein
MKKLSLIACEQGQEAKKYYEYETCSKIQVGQNNQFLEEANANNLKSSTSLHMLQRLQIWTDSMIEVTAH